MKFRICNIVTLIIVAALIAAAFLGVTIRWWYFVLVAWAWVTVVFTGCINIRLDFFMPVKCRADTNEQVVALSFDDGPHPVYTPRILNTLKQHRIPATFFCIGKNIVGNESLLQRIKAEGHIIGNHSHTHHFWFDMFGPQKMLADMRQMDNAVAAVTGVKPLLFRPPYGVMNPNLKKAIIDGKYCPVGWSIRSLDTVIKDKQKLLFRTTGQLKPGDIILLHDSMEITAEVLPEIIEQIRNRGFKIVPLHQLLNVAAYA